MHQSHTVKLETRECWLPFVQQLAMNNGWDIFGDDIEDLVDRVAPYLGNATITTPEGAERILTNYYHDAPLIQLLLYGNSHQSDTLWGQISSQYMTSLRDITVEGEEQVTRIDQIQGQLRELLAQHTYQVPLWAVVISFV